MHPDRWRQIENLYHAALERDAAAREEYLREASAGDDDLQREVEQLLAYQTRADNFIGTPAVNVAARQEAAAHAPDARFRLREGTRLGPYEIVKPLGAGGMGEVYRARDTRLAREVAVKILPAEVASDPARRRRFEIEARAVAALNHPNIVALYDVGEGYLVSELVDGKPLQAGKLALPKVLNVAVQIANGLAAAHAAGITHRDLKPGNILLTREGRAKILDFGLAKMTQPRVGAAGTETITAQTEPGVVMGTVGYMSPEQVRNQEVDGRSDIFSLGVILHEMLSGARPFRGETSTDIMHAILRQDPPELPASVPAAVKKVVTHCLEKDPNNRFQSAQDLAFALEAASGSQSTVPAPRPRALPKWAIPAAALAVATGAVWFWLARPLPLPRVTGMVEITHDGRPKYGGDDTSLAQTAPPTLSEGSRLFFEDGGPYQVSAKGGDAVPLVLQTKGNLLDITPDHNEFLTCVGNPLGQGSKGCQLWGEPVLGGSPHRLGNLMVDEAAWSPDGRQIVYTKDRALHLASRDGTDLGTIAAVPGQPFRPRWSPDGRSIRFSLSAGSGKPTRLWRVQKDGTGLQRLLPAWNPSWNMCCGNWTPDGRYFIFEGNQRLWAVREGFVTRRAGQQPVQLNTGLLAATNPLVGSDGKRLYFEGRQERDEFLRYDLKSGRYALDFPSISGFGLEISKDGKWIAYALVPGGALIRSAVDGTQRLQLTSPPMGGAFPHWSSDGKEIAFTGGPDGKQARIFVVPSDGGVPRQVSNGEAGPWGDIDPSWSPDGASLAFGTTSSDQDPKQSIHVVDLRTNRVSALPGSEGMWSPRWSPDGRFIAGFSGSTWKPMLYDLRTHQQTELFGGTSGYPSWSRDGEFLYFGSGSDWWRVRMSDRKAELVNTVKDMTLAGWGWFGVAPDNTLITARDIGTDEIFALDLDLP